jgi:hypothetical protein
MLNDTRLPLITVVGRANGNLLGTNSSKRQYEIASMPFKSEWRELFSVARRNKHIGGNKNAGVVGG